MPAERARVLVVEDDAAIRELLRAALELDGYAVATAADRGPPSYLSRGLSLVLGQELPNVLRLVGL